MVWQKLDLVDEEILATEEVLHKEVNDEKLPASDIAHGQVKVIAFDSGDAENAANWSTVRTGPC